ncbi:hypothetical protein NX059_005299 [Plenodomus lindquistii]|nr:hypothetical protein NX059_005299 [Plenodomus lindquistii]
MSLPKDYPDNPSFDDIEFDQSILFGVSPPPSQTWNTTASFDQPHVALHHVDDIIYNGFDLNSNIYGDPNSSSPLLNQDLFGFGTYDGTTNDISSAGWNPNNGDALGIQYDQSALPVKQYSFNQTFVNPRLVETQSSPVDSVIPSGMQQDQEVQQTQQSSVANDFSGNNEVPQFPSPNKSQLVRVSELGEGLEQTNHNSEREDQTNGEHEPQERHHPVQSIEPVNVSLNTTYPSGGELPETTARSTSNQIDDIQRVQAMARASNMSKEQKEQALAVLQKLDPTVLEAYVTKHKHHKKMLAKASVNLGQGPNLNMVTQPQYGATNIDMNTQSTGHGILGPPAPRSQGPNTSSLGPIMQPPSTLYNTQPGIINNNNNNNNGYCAGLLNNVPQYEYPQIYSGRSDTSQSARSHICPSEFSSGSQSGYSSAPTSLASGSRLSKMPSQTALSNGTQSAPNHGPQASYTKASRSRRSNAASSIGSNSHVSKTPSQSMMTMQHTPVPAMVQNMPPPTGNGYQLQDIFQLAPGAVAQDCDTTMTEATYRPTNDDFTPTSPTAQKPAYAGYAAFFRSSAAATAHRKSTRIPPKKLAPDVQRVIRYGRTHSHFPPAFIAKQY